MWTTITGFFSTYANIIRIALFVVALSCAGYVGFRIGDARYLDLVAQTERDKATAAQEALDHETKVVALQAQETKKAQDEKAAIENHYQLLLAQYRGIGLRQSSTGGINQPAPTPVPSQGLRLLEPDVEVLIGFAKQCAITESERNEVIEKYNDLSVK